MFRPTLQQQSYGWRYYQPKLQYTVIRTTIPLRNSVISLGLALLSAIQEHPKNRNIFCKQAHFLDLSIQGHATI